MKNMNTTIRNKLIIVLLLSIIVLGGGGFYLYLQYTYFAKKYDKNTILLLNGTTKPEKIIIAQAQVPESNKSARSRVQYGNEPEIAVAMSNSSSPSMGNTAFPTHSFGFQQSSGLSGYSSRDIENKQIYSGGGGGMLFAANGNKGGVGISSSPSFGGGFASGQPAFVPFKEDNPNKLALVDPGIEIEMIKITPVGDSLWLLLLLAIAYVGIKRFKR